MPGHLELNAIQVRYGDVIAIPRLFLEIEAGEFFCLLGPSGCGKSTTLNVIAGFVPVISGRVMLRGQDITELSPQKREIGVVFQSYALFPHMTAEENIGYGLKLRKLAKAEIDSRVNAALALVRLEGKGDRRPRELSGGEQQRVAIARALAINPGLLLLDEPLSNLDARLRSEMRSELKHIQRTTGVTTVFVTHDQHEAFGTGDRIAVLNKGHVEQVGSPSEIYKRPASPFVAEFIGRSNRLHGHFDAAAGVIAIGDQRIAVDAPASGSIGNAMLYLRPEEVQLNSETTHPNAVSGTVKSFVYGGSTIEYQIATPLGDLEVWQLAGDSPLAIGAPVTASWPASAGIVLEVGEA